MKAFWGSVFALLALLCLVIWNSMYISGITDDMSELAFKISSLENDAEFASLEQLWGKSKSLISVSIPHAESDELEKNLILLRAKFDNGIEVELEETVALILRAIEEIKIHGAPSIDNVF